MDERERNQKELSELSEFEEFEKFNLKKAEEKIEDNHISFEETVKDLINEIEAKKKKEKKNYTAWWGARKTAEMAFICTAFWWLLQTNQDNMINYFSYIDEKIELIRESVGKTTLDTEQAVIVMSDLIKNHHNTQMSYFDKTLKARYPQNCIKDNNQTNCERRIKSDLERKKFYLVSRLNKFSSDKGLLGNYFKENYPIDRYIQDVNAILFMDLRKNYKMEALSVLIMDYETQFIRDFQESLDKTQSNL